MKHLWQIKHPYSAQQGHTEFSSWALFFEAEGDADDDLNLLYRWDWDKKEKTLELYFIGQRKALPRSVYVHGMGPEDENNVRKFLERKWRKICDIWEGVAE